MKCRWQVNLFMLEVMVMKIRPFQKAGTGSSSDATGGAAYSI